MPVIKVLFQNNTLEINARCGDALSRVLGENGFTVSAACGGRGVCKKCSVRLVSGSFDNVTPDENGMIRSCRALVSGDAVIEAAFEYKSLCTDIPLINSPGAHSSQGVAVDIGTTTVAAALLKADGSTVSASALNPQSAYGADVISRITACTDGKLAALRDCVRDCVNSLINELTDGAGTSEAIIAGNTVMLHIFCGVSPETIGVFPFTPQFTSARVFDGADLGLNVKKVTVLPSVSGYIGADILAGVYALGLHKSENTALLADLGTNGEIVLSYKGGLSCASAAAGPALEGACTECGVGGIKGAVCAVFDAGGSVGYKTVGDAKPVGICGAGLVDAAALMLEKELMDETGFVDDGRFYITEDIYVSQSDIRQLQLAKSAVYSAVQTLAEKAGAKKIDEMYVAGGLGYFINFDNAFKIKLLPQFDGCRVQSAGNTSLKGALMCIGNAAAVAEMGEIAKKCVTEELGGDKSFNDGFMQNMYFD